MFESRWIQLKGMWKFGGARLLFAYIRDRICHSKTRERIINGIIAKNITTENDHSIEEKAAAYFCMKTGQTINYLAPQTFNEKIRWMMLYDSTPLKTQLTDKYRVREFVEKRIGAEYLIPLLGVWNKFEQINFEKLPEQYVLKCTHGSGMNVVVKNRDANDYESMRLQFGLWLETNFAYRNFELQYKEISPLIIAEKYIEEGDGNLLDYKVHCFNGEPRYIQVIGNRNLKEHTGRQLLYDFDANRLDWTFGDYPRYEQGILETDKLQLLYGISKRLAKDFDYVRVDLYIIRDKVLFGEMTFTPNAGLYTYNKDFTESVNRMLGSLIKIST